MAEKREAREQKQDKASPTTLKAGDGGGQDSSGSRPKTGFGRRVPRAETAAPERSGETGAGRR